MTVRAALVFLLAVGLTGCVTSGDQNPLKTDKGRDEARDAYIQLGLGYLQRGNTEQAKVPLRKALEIDPSSADAHAALAVVFQTEMEPKLADEEYRKALASDSRNARVLKTTAVSSTSRSATRRPISVSWRPARTPSIPSARGSSRTSAWFRCK